MTSALASFWSRRRWPDVISFSCTHEPSLWRTTWFDFSGNARKCRILTGDWRARVAEYSHTDFHLEQPEEHELLTSTFVLATSLVLATTGAFAEAGDLHINDRATFSSTVAREQVKAELHEATRLGLVSVGEGEMFRSPPPSRSV